MRDRRPVAQGAWRIPASSEFSTSRRSMLRRIGSNLQACGGCDVQAGADSSAPISTITGTVQKVSNLILNMNVYLRDVGDGPARHRKPAPTCAATPTNPGRVPRNYLRAETAARAAITGAPQ